ncbi:rhomboid family intramembrane serine protease [Zunongwangia sp. SCSIO 43204]|uniref:rhomboid family intramembrane serine protease n=1 Tax=Zunongwangia sp. SCSIO 43204 TaxID=2779359 RepID=UPI001CA8FAD8|nr:rhomboid family intramembrane serine protease [Zunongwangia sp. SCSIO 43204]UAB82797.1 rhomboid family intramembrane serine protease [Zunongwangia sp. SCSIO 43204]
MRTSDRIRYKINTASVTEKLIAVNVIVFLFFGILNTIFSLFEIPGFANFYDWFVLPSDPAEFILKPWTIISYSFLHGGIFHLISNMLILYFSGIYFLNFFSPKRLLNYYFLGVIIGGLVFMLSYNLFPAFAGGKSYLVGASAGVMAVLIGVATQAPNMYVRLLILGNLKFWWIAAALVAIDIIQIPMGNAGGHLAHLGGAGLGYLYTTQLHKGNDIGAWWENLMDGIANLFKKREKKAKMKTVHRTSNKRSGTSSSNSRSTSMSKSEKQQKVDAILDKISKSGYESLTKAEKDFLFQAGKDD